MKPDGLSLFVFGLTLLGALGFGIVIGWVTNGALRRAKRDGLTDITTVIGAVGGAAVTGLFSKETGAFGAYCIGLAIGFFYYVRVATRPGAPNWLGEAPGSGASGTGTGLPQTARG